LEAALVTGAFHLGAEGRAANGGGRTRFRVLRQGAPRGGVWQCAERVSSSPVKNVRALIITKCAVGDGRRVWGDNSQTGSVPAGRPAGELDRPADLEGGGKRFGSEGRPLLRQPFLFDQLDLALGQAEAFGDELARPSHPHVLVL